MDFKPLRFGVVRFIAILGRGLLHIFSIWGTSQNRGMSKDKRREKNDNSKDNMRSKAQWGDQS